jgi:hypothetical protein
MSGDKKTQPSPKQAAVLLLAALVFSGVISPRHLHALETFEKVKYADSAHADKVRQHAREDEIISDALTQGLLIGVAIAVIVWMVAGFIVATTLLATGVIS